MRAAGWRACNSIGKAFNSQLTLLAASAALLLLLCPRLVSLRSYFAALAKGDVEAFLEEQSKKKKQADAAAAAGQQQY